MNSMRQGSVIDEHGCPVDPIWDEYQRALRRDGIAVLPLSRPVCEKKEAAEEEGEE